MSSALKIVGLVIRWPLSVFLLLLSVTGVITGDVMAGIGIALMGAVLLPVLRQVGGIKLTPWVRVGVVAVGFIVFAIGVPRKSSLPTPVVETESMSSATFSGGSQGSVGESQQVSQTAEVVSVIDGDTIRVKLADGKEQKVRVIGLDAPEVSPLQCFGKESSNHLSSFIAGKGVTLESEPQDDRDIYGRLLRYISFNGQDIGAAMIRDGYAESYRKYPHPRIESYNSLEASAKERKAGLWSACAAPVAVSSKAAVATPLTQPTSPQPQAQTGNGECVIKGNVNAKKDRIYHLPGCGSYTQTQIRPGEGDRWFCTEAEAQAAGFRKAGNCR
ncbi:hypothetical protein AUJ46_01090 [Candidatus Peregrinibacteria bacterium CG1_02_54_53]|nr:MAG: hypothetical protein AUJ46_01090 [Candidatus Peregrinibacteria bacterium CG1_02_54_53]